MAADELPSGTVTLLFTDIEGSTGLVKQLRGRYGDVLADHRRLLRAAFDAHGGREIDTQGDAFFVAFPRAKGAVAAAVDGQIALAGHAWPDGAQVRVRMGLHSGEPFLGEGGYHGLGLHRGARICSAGHGGQILLSNVTRELIADEPLDGIDLLDLGERRLKDVDRPERIAQVVYPGMPASFPPLKTVDAQPADAPFEGREDALAAEVAARFGWVRTGPRRALAIGVVVAVAGALAIAVIARGGGDDVTAKLTADSLGILSANGRELVASVPVGTSPSGVAVGEGSIWVTNADEQTVSRVDPDSHRVTQTIGIGGSPEGVAVAGGFVWVSNAADGTVSQIDPRAGGGKELQRIAVGNQPTALAAGRGAVWVANSVDSTITPIDAATGKAGAPVKVSGGADALAVGAGSVWVVGERAGVVTPVDEASGQALAPIPVGQGPRAVAVGAGAVWVANTLDGTVSKVDPERGSVASLIPVGREPRGIAVGTRVVWVSDESGHITKIDPGKGTVKGDVVVGNRPSAIAVDAKGLYVALRPAGTAHRGGVLRIAVASGGLRSIGTTQFDSLDPGRAYEPLTWGLVSSTNDGLVAFRRVGGSAGSELVPDLATSLPHPSADGRSYSFRLRRGIRYSTGERVVASDIRYGIERALSIEGSPSTQYLTTVVGAAACIKHPRAACDLSRGIQTSDSAGTITFRLTAPNPDLLYQLALPSSYAVPRTVPRHEVPGGVPATGPYKVSRVSKKRVELVRNPRFVEWSHAAKPDGYPDRIEIHGGGKPGDQIAQVERGTIDYAADAFFFSPAEKAQLRTLRASQVHISPERTTIFVFLNTTRPPFDDARARKAVNLAVDRRAGLASPINGIATCQLLPPGFAGYRHYCPFPTTPDIAEARRLVRASGTSGAHVTVSSPGAGTPALSRMKKVVRAMNAIGYHARIRDLGDHYFEAATAPGANAQAGFNAWAPDYPGAGGFMTPLISCKGSFNLSRFCDRGVEASIRRAGRLAPTDQQAASEVWARVDRRVTDLAPVVPLVNLTDFQFVGERVGNYQYNPQWYVLLDQLWVR